MNSSSSTPTIRTSVSDLKTFMDCPQKWLYRSHLKRGPRRVPLALRLGTAVHKALEKFLLGSHEPNVLWMDVCLDTAVNELNAEPDVIKEIEILRPVLRGWAPKERWEIIVTEVPMTYTFPSGDILQGTMDCIVKIEGQGYYHLQHKTVGAGKKLTDYAAIMERDWHECIYQAMAIEQNFVPYKGTILNVIRKLAPSTIAKNPAAALFTQYIGREPFVVEKALADAYAIMQQMKGAMQNPTLAIQNRDACGGPYGNSLCPYMGVCNRIDALYDDALFTDLEDRYAKTK